jgi:hypothetical protein
VNPRGFYARIRHADTRTTIFGYLNGPSSESLVYLGNPFMFFSRFALQGDGSFAIIAQGMTLSLQAGSLGFLTFVNGFQNVFWYPIGEMKETDKFNDIPLRRVSAVLFTDVSTLNLVPVDTNDVATARYFRFSNKGYSLAANRNLPPAESIAVGGYWAAAILKDNITDPE